MRAVEMDAVWIKTVRQIEIDLAGYRQMKRATRLERDDRLLDLNGLRLQRLRESLNHRYSQLIAFTAGLSKETAAFDCDLEDAARVIRSPRGFRFVFGPSALSSVSPHMSPEFREFVEYTRLTRAENATSDGDDTPCLSEIAIRHLGFFDSIVEAIGEELCGCEQNQPRRRFMNGLASGPRLCGFRSVRRLDQFAGVVAHRLPSAQIVSREIPGLPDFEFLS